MTNVSSDFSDVCDQIDTLINTVIAKYFILAGDLNVDCRRNNAHFKWIAEMTDRHGLFDAWTLPQSNPGDTYISYSLAAKSRIDYFMCPHSLSGNIYGVEVLELSNNPSNHRPIKLGLKLNDQINTDEVEKNENTHTNPTRIAWNKVTDKHIKYYQKELDEMLKHMSLPSVVYCQELNCDNETHKVKLTSDAVI
jgi:hypothetical protein